MKESRVQWTGHVLFSLSKIYEKILQELTQPDVMLYKHELKCQSG